MGLDGPKESCIRWGTDPQEKAIFMGKGRPIVKYRDARYAVSCPKTAEPIEMLFGLEWAQRSMY